jgi:putative tryptophan/tyrosine transport system substrate-binding protein
MRQRPLERRDDYRRHLGPQWGTLGDEVVLHVDDDESDSLYKVFVALAVPLSALTDVRPGKRAVVPSQDAEKIFALVTGTRRPAAEMRRAYEMLCQILDKGFWFTWRSGRPEAPGDGLSYHRAAMLNRRRFLGALSASLFSGPHAVGAQPMRKVHRVGVLLPTPVSRIPATGVFRQALHDLGYIEGQNLLLEYRTIDADKLDRLPALATELVSANVDVIFAVAGAAHAAKNATKTIPIVFAGVGDPVRTGLVTSLAHPGGNVTGLTNTAPDLSGKRLQLLTEMAPGVSRVAVLWNSNNPIIRGQVSETEAAARDLKVQLQVVPIHSADDFASAFSTITAQRAGAVVVIADVLILAHRERIAALALTHRLPTISEFPDFAVSGGLIAYGPSAADAGRRAAGYVDRILKGARPADLPVQQPNTFELVINLKTAKALGLTIPPSLLARADQIIE